jgi:hypothetical protein
VPVILCGNKIDLRGGEVTNQDLEQEIMPIMNEFKVRSTDGLPRRRSLPTLAANQTLQRFAGGRDVRGDVGKNDAERDRGHLLCAQSRLLPARTIVRLAGTRTPLSDYHRLPWLSSCQC